jgi:protein ImuB
MFATLFIPDFALQAALRYQPELRQAAIALIPEKTARARILQSTALARAAGALPGMTPSQGQARCPELQILIRTPEAERCARAAVLDCAGAFSAYLEDTADGVCTLELKRVRNLRVEEFAESLLGRIARLQLEARVGFAPKASLALLAAQSTERWRQVRTASELGGLPLTSLAFPAPMLEILTRWGIRTLGEFTALGQEALTERLGPEVLPLLAQAQGNVERPLRCTRQAETYEESVEFEHEFETLEPLLFVIRRLLEQITLRLETSYLVAADLTLRLGFANGGGEHERLFKIPAPTARVEVLFRALHTYLEQFTAEQPINRLQLVATPCRPSRQQFGLFENALRDPNQFFETLARLIALLGHDRVGVPTLEDTHRPDAFRVREVALEPAPMENGKYGKHASHGSSGAHTSYSSHPSQAPTGLCLRRFRPPVPAQVELDATRQPVALTSAALRGRARESTGPMHLSGEWWDARPWRRAEWDLELQDGTLCRVCEEDERWSLEGIYD